MLDLVVISLMFAAPSPAPSPEARPSPQSKAAVEALEEAEKADKYLGPAREKKAKLARKEIEEFAEEVEEYLDIHRKARKKLPPLSEEADAVAATTYGEKLAVVIRQDRKDAKQGDLLNPRLAAALRRILKAELATGAERHLVLTEGNPTGDEENQGPVKVAVNAHYIPAAPLSTVPPTLLLQLPPLPEELHYRFVGRTLILRDSIANLIVDYLPNAVP
jgi:hypothetical protein